MPTIRNVLNSYYRALQQSNDPIVCPLCKLSMFPKLFEKHCRSQHDINATTCCVWCQKLSWKYGEKYKYGSHLRDCYRNFIIPSPRSYRLATIHHTHKEKDFYGHVLIPVFISEFIPLDLTASQFDRIWPLETDSSPAITFSDNNLNLAASYVQKYLETRESHDWIHIMVKSVAFESFVGAMNEDNGICRTLEFSCWCDGGPYKPVKYNQHRHMIVVSSPKGHFKKNVWPKVKVSPENKPPIRNFPCKRSKPIESPLHLVNTMGYLSNRKSRCNFSFEDNKSPIRSKHFYIYKTLPTSFKLHLVQFWNDGIFQLLYQEKLQNISVERLADSPITKVDGPWKQKIKDFYGLERGLVLNVSKQFVPTDKITPYFFCLRGGQKLYFECCPFNEETWLQKQVEGGNCFYDAIEETVWVPRLRDQRVLNFYKPVLDRKNELESENARLKEQLDLKENVMNRNIQELKCEISKLKTKVAELDSTLCKLKH